MQIEWTNLLLQGFAGGITGYVTNNYALNMLFREYTPLKLGGVIKKTKSEFIDAISELVERDLLSPSHLKNEFLKEEALEEWNILFASLWDEFFQAEFQQVPFNEIPGIQKALPNWIDTLVTESLEPICDGRLPLPELSLGDLLSEESFAFLTKRILMQSVAEMQQGAMLDTFLPDLLAPLEGKTLADFLDHSELDQMDKGLQRLLAQSLDHGKQNPELLTEALQTLLRTKEFESMVDQWESTWGQEPLDHLLTAEQKEEMQAGIMHFFARLSQNDVQAACAKSLQPLLAESALLDRPLLSLFTEESKAAIHEWIRTVYHNGFDRLLVFLEERESLLKYRVKQAAQAELSAQSGMLGGMIQSPLFKAIDELNLVQTLSDYRNQGEEGLIRLLNAKSCRDLGLSVTEEQIHVLSQSIITAASKRWQPAFDALLKQSPVELFGSNWFQTLREKSRQLDAEKAVIRLSDWLENHSKNHDWSSVLQLQWSHDLSHQLLQALKAIDLQPLQNTLLDQSEKLYSTMKTQAIPADWLSSMLAREDIQEGIKRQINQIAETEMDQPIHRFLSGFNQTESRNAFGENLIELLEKHGEEFLNGQVAGLVKTNLEQRDEEEIVDLAHDFIGRELQPITKFGFLLGMIAGVLLALFPLPRTLMAGPIDLFPMAIFAAVGVLTNWIALQMIFRPYQEVRWLKHIPFFRHFSQGYLLKNQRAFAENLAKFVDESLLNRNMIQQLFSDQKKTLKQRWLKWIPKSLPSWSKLALQKKQKELAQGVGVQVQKAVEEHTDAWSHSMSASLGAATLPLDAPRLQEWLKTNGLESIRRNGLDWLEKNQSKSLDHWISSDTLSTIFTPVFNRLRWRLPEEIVPSLAADFASGLLIKRSLPQKGQSLEDIFGGALADWTRANKEGILHRLTQSAQGEILNREAQLAHSVNNRIQEGLNFLQRGGFVLMGGPALIERILHRVIAEELPDFLRTESEGILEVFAPTVETLLTFEQKESWQLEQDTRQHLSRDLKAGINEILRHGDLTVQQFSLNRKAADDWIQSTHQQMPWADQQLAATLSSFAAPAFSAASLKNVLDQLPKRSLASIKDIIQSADTTEAVIEGGWQTVTGTLARNTVLGDWIPVSLLVQQVESLLTRIGTEPQIGTLIAGMAESALPTVTDQIMTTEPIVEWMAENSFDPLYQAAHGQLPALLSTLSFQSHIITEVDALSPREIHQIFLSFAGTYFFRLEVYGLFGAVFGLHPVLPGLALVSEGWNAMKLKQRRNR